MNAKKFKELQMLMAEGDSDEIPVGWMTRQEVSKHIGKSQVTADKFISKCVETGAMKRMMLRRPTNSGVRPVPYFSFPTANAESAKLNPRLRRKR